MMSNVKENESLPKLNATDSAAWNHVFNSRERRALEYLGITSYEEFLHCDLVPVTQIPYVGELTYRSLFEKQQNTQPAQNTTAKMANKSSRHGSSSSTSLYELDINPKELEAFRNIGVTTVEDFLHCDLEKISNFPGIGKKKLLKLKKLQDQQKGDSFSRKKNSNTLSEYISSFDWTTREFNALREANIQTVRDFLQYEIRQFKDRKKVGRKTFQGLFEKQKRMFEQYGSLLMKEWDDQERPLLMFSELDETEQEFLTSLGMTSIQEFIFADYRLLALNEKNAPVIQSLVGKQKMFKERIVTGDLEPPQVRINVAVPKRPAALPAPVVERIRPVHLQLYEQWEKNVNEQSLRNLPFFSNHFNKGFFPEHFHASFCADYPLESLVLPKRLLNMLKKAGISRLGELFLTPRCFFEKVSYCSQDTVSITRTVLEEFLIDNKHKRYEPDFSSSDAFAVSLVQYISNSLKRKDRWMRLHVAEDRRHQILMQRAADKTLDEVGQAFEITRERIRQIEHNMWRQIASFKNRLELVENLLVDVLSSLGGYVKDRVFYRKLAERNHWPFSAAKYFGEHFLKIFANRFRVNAEDYICFESYKCATCPYFYDVLCADLTQLEHNGEILSIDRLAVSIRKRLPKTPECKKCVEKNHSFPIALFYWLFESQPRFKDYRKNKTIRMTTKLGLYESILLALKLAHRPLTKKEILLEVQKLCPKLKITEKQIKTTAGNSLQHTREILLWNRGGMNSESMYVYKDYVNTDLVILETIENDLLARARKSRVPQMRLNRVYSIYAQECLSQGIPNVYALFASLKCRANPQLTFQRSPYIGFAGQKQKISNAVILEKFVRDRGGFVSSNTLKSFGRSLGLRDEHIQNTIALTKLLATRKGYVLFDSFDRDGERFKKITQAVREKLQSVEHLTVMEVFQANKELYESLEIQDARMLYHLLKRFAEDIFTLEFPIVSIKKKGGRRSLKLRVARRILRYLTEKKGPVSAKKLFEHFSDRLGYPQAAVGSALTSREILFYGNNVFIHESALHWNKERQTELANLVLRYREEELKNGIPYCTVERFIGLYKSQLTKPAPGIQWNRHLLASLICRMENVVFFGNCHNVFVFTNDEGPLKTFGDFLKYILLRQFDGNTSLRDFTKFLSSRIKVVKRELSVPMIEEYKDLAIENGRIFVKDSPDSTSSGESLHIATPTDNVPSLPR
ncbi:MAG: DNA-directed RNA polymerase subunit alpha C-terminal domain-containing protein [Thermoguttaceae bacterium]|nr:DNA-directed RNA polymerase subunit alpha C-terminal domain-containing protein [Thermoguttaceae bacterium]